MPRVTRMQTTSTIIGAGFCLVRASKALVLLAVTLSEAAVGIRRDWRDSEAMSDRTSIGDSMKTKYDGQGSELAIRAHQLRAATGDRPQLIASNDLASK